MKAFLFFLFKILLGGVSLPIPGIGWLISIFFFLWAISDIVTFFEWLAAPPEDTEAALEFMRIALEANFSQAA